VFDAGISLAGPIVPGPEGRVYFITADGMLRALDSNGRERWRRPSGGIAPAVSNNGTIFALGRQSSLYALSPKGRPLWTITLDSASGPLAASGDTAYVEAGGELWAVVGPGLVQWRTPVDGEITAAAITSDDGIVTGVDGGALAAFSSEGVARWSFEPEGGFAGEIVTLGDTVYGGSGAGVLYALDASAGTELWHLSTFGSVSAGPVAGSSGLLFFESDSLYAVGSDGRIAWQKGFVVPGPLAPDPAGGVFAPDADKRDAMFNADGNVRWSTRSFGPVAGTAVSAEGMLYVATADGRVYAVR
jgi:outer membrane protein assembly factor BamB